jgi:hypothetical protein
MGSILPFSVKFLVLNYVYRSLLVLTESGVGLLRTEFGVGPQVPKKMLCNWVMFALQLDKIVLCS